MSVEWFNGSTVTLALNHTMPNMYDIDFPHAGIDILLVSLAVFVLLARRSSSKSDFRCQIELPGLTPQQTVSAPQDDRKGLFRATGIIQAYMRKGRYEEAIDLFLQILKNRTLKVDDVLLSCVLAPCMRERRQDDCLEIVRQLKIAGVQPPPIALAATLKVFKDFRRQGPEALAIVKEILADNGIGEKLTVAKNQQKQGFWSNLLFDSRSLHKCYNNYENLCQALIFNGACEEALQLYERLLELHEERIDSLFYYRMVNNLIKMGHHALAVKVLRCAYHLPNHGLKVTAGPAHGILPNMLQKVIGELRWIDTTLVSELIDGGYASIDIFGCGTKNVAEVLSRKLR
eukprot:TRINITY_DN8687_c0_g1_i8.p1 TRINITY_DN8687_c0_g1~~TRINITY_DN8687_c0_g1_i8.p1  ORF type:complete len:345 (+),score=37.58 TRINITY_DN8687_c0_g1_i8:66-1100(+)